MPSTRLTLLEWDAIRTALGFLLAGEPDGVEDAVVEAAERAQVKLLQREDDREAARRRRPGDRSTLD